MNRYFLVAFGFAFVQTAEGICQTSNTYNLQKMMEVGKRNIYITSRHLLTVEDHKITLEQDKMQRYLG